MTMHELEIRLECNPWDLWDSICNYLPLSATFEECAKLFAQTYGVTLEEVKEYFMEEDDNDYLV